MSSEKPIRPGLRGGRVADAGSFPDEQEAYRNMTPGERMEAVYELSCRLYEIARANDDGQGRLPGIPNRLIGGRR